MKYIVKISPEITIKSKPVRKRCILLLKKNILKHFSYFGINALVSGNWDCIEVDGEDEKILDLLGKIPGIANFVEVKDFCFPEEKNEIFGKIFEKTKKYYLDLIKGKTFVVRVKRSGKHDFRSIDLEKYIGGGLLEYGENTKVKLKNPHVVVKIEVKDEKFFIIKNFYNGIGGYPVGFQGKVLSLISGGFDSGVSTFKMAKRGCFVDYLFFNLGGDAHEFGVREVSHYLWKNFMVSYKKARFICINFEEIVGELLKKVNHKYRGIILKRLMLTVSSILSEGKYYAIIKGDSLGQVSSQTLKNMHVIDKASKNLVLRPLIGLNKQEIIDISQKIGTYDFACNMPEYCGIISDKPSTGAKEKDILEEEKKIDFEIILKAIENKKVDFVENMMKNYKQKEKKELEVVFFPGKNEIIIDIRGEEQKKKVLNFEKTEILNIPFYEINEKFKNLDQQKTYLFFCEKGILSNIHGFYLREKGFKNIKILKNY